MAQSIGSDSFLIIRLIVRKGEGEVVSEAIVKDRETTSEGPATVAMNAQTSYDYAKGYDAIGSRSDSNS